MREFRLSLRVSSGFGISWALLLFVVASCVAQASAQCEQWDLSGGWTLDQNDGYRVEMNLKQIGTELSGTAAYAHSRGAGRAVGGTVKGTIVGDGYDAEITWDKGGVGVYRGTLIPTPGPGDSTSRLMDGTVTNKANPSSPVRWSRREKIKCTGSASPPAEPFKTSPTASGCRRWDASGPWSLIQDDGFTVYVSLRQNGTALVGSADYTGEKGPGSGPLVGGGVKGEVRGDNFSVRITWGNALRQVADYTGKIDATGKIVGSVFVGNRRGFGWSSIGSLKCVEDDGVILR